MITARSMVLENVSLIAGAYGIKKDGVFPIEGTVVISEGEPQAVTPLLAVTGKPQAALYKSFPINSSGIFRVYGTVIPVGATIHLVNEEDFIMSDLHRNVFASCVSDEYGNWHIDDVRGWDGNCVAWAYIGGDFTAATTSTITAEKELTTYLGGGGSSDTGGSDGSGDTGDSSEDTPDLNNTAFQYAVDYSLRDVSDEGWPAITINGSCTTGASEVHISEMSFASPETECDCCDGGGYVIDNPSLKELISSEVSYADVTNSSYTASFDGSYQQAYIAWAYGDTGEVTMSLEYTVKSCLSGDTLITMADRSRKRMDELQIGEFVLSNEGAATEVVDIVRGYYADNHTLYEFEDGTVIDEVGRHRFYNMERGFWQYLGLWAIGEHALREDGTCVALVKKTRVNERAEMFGLWTQSQDYFANGLLTGETAANKSVLSDIDVDTAADILSTLDVRALMDLTGLERALP